MLRVTMWDTCEALAITEEQREVLQTWIGARNSPQKVVFRARIVLAAAGGLSNNRIAQELKTTRPTVILWRNHFLKGGVAGLEHEPPRKTSSQRTKGGLIKDIVEAILHTTP